MTTTRRAGRGSGARGLGAVAGGDLKAAHPFSGLADLRGDLLLLHLLAGRDLVDDVADDAVRWSKALAAAGAEMLAEMKARDDVHQTFADAWSEWTYKADGVRENVPLDPSWRESVDALLAAGLPMPALIDAVHVAMTRDKVKHGNRFRYMCGVAWRKVEQIRERAGQIATAHPRPDDEEALVPDSVLEAAQTLLECLDDDEREIYLDGIRAEYGDDDDAAVYYLALEKALDELITQRWQLDSALRKFLTFYSEEEVERHLELSRQEHREMLGDDSSEAGVLAYATSQISRHDRAVVYLARLPNLEREEWETGARTYLGPEASDRDVEILAAEHAQKNKRVAEKGQFAALPGTCLARGDHGARCPSLAEHLVFVDACGENPCAGHQFCGRHLDLVIDGTYTTREGDPIKVLNFTELPDTGDPGADETPTKGE